METAIKLFNRLNEIEKINLRGAGPDRLAHLAYANFLSDLPLENDAERLAIVTEVKAMCDLQFAAKGSSTEFGQTWFF